MAMSQEDYAGLVKALVVSSGGLLSAAFILGDEYGSLQTLDAVHAAVHRGRYYTHANLHSGIAAGAFVDHVFKVNSGTEPHMRLGGIEISGGPFAVQLFEDAQVNSYGEVATFRCTNRRFPDANGMTIHEHANVTSTGAALMTALISGTSKAGGGANYAETEWVLRDRINYLLRITNMTAQLQDMSLTQSWYEL